MYGKAHLLAERIIDKANADGMEVVADEASGMLK